MRPGSRCLQPSVHSRSSMRAAQRIALSKVEGSVLRNRMQLQSRRRSNTRSANAWCTGGALPAALSRCTASRRHLCPLAHIDAFVHVHPQLTPMCPLYRRSFNYRGAIIGFDHTCQQTEAWMRSMNIDELKYGRQQPFYHVLPDTRDRPGAQVGTGDRPRSQTKRMSAHGHAIGWEERGDYQKHVRTWRIFACVHAANAPHLAPHVALFRSPMWRKKTLCWTRPRRPCSILLSTRCSRALMQHVACSFPIQRCKRHSHRCHERARSDCEQQCVKPISASSCQGRCTHVVLLRHA